MTCDGPYPASCVGERCDQCRREGCWQDGGWARHELGEVVFDDDPNPCRHPLVAYLCCDHFRRVVGGSCGSTVGGTWTPRSPTP